MMIVACGMPSRDGEDDACLRVALVVGLQARQDQVERFLAHGVGEHVGDRRRVGRSERLVLDVDRAVGAARQRLPQHLRDARGPGGADDDFAAVLLAQAQALPRARRRPARSAPSSRPARGCSVPSVGQARLPLAGRDLLDADGDLHGSHAEIVADLKVATTGY